LCASFQAAVTDVVADRARNAIAACRASFARADTLVVAGGVAANAVIRAALGREASRAKLRLIAPPARLCTDNAAMIAWAGAERLALGRTDPFDTPARPRWPLDEVAPAKLGAGAKGPRA